ncbi:synaptosomal-associated protein 47-like, partial [Diadema setosum]|uniref:synaptosomal-associated protein 47-like n=1 Tax=Diadema setosum TaxID=31175 RepID=UPI003B3AA802
SGQYFEQQPVVRQWKGTFYRDIDKRWIKGHLLLTNRCLAFQEQTSDNVCLSLDIDRIVDVKVERAWMGYNTVVVLFGKEKFWFSSFASSQSVKQLLLHFIKESLLLSPGLEGQMSSTSDQSSRTKLGSELLSIAEDSHRTLGDAALQLSAQGEQLDDALRKTDVMERYVDVGNRSISYLESWLGRWNVSSRSFTTRESKKEVQAMQQGLKLPQDFPVVYQAKSNKEESGVLIISPEDILIQDGRKNMAFKFGLRDISVINVPSPWTLVITRRMIGQADIRCELMSARVISILKILEKSIKNKIEYDEPQEVAFAAINPASKRQPTDREALFAKCDGHSSAEPSRRPDHNQPIGGQQIQVSSQSDVVTESEAAELSGVLKDLKSLAVEVGSELDVQDEKISELTSSVTHLTENMDTSNRRMQKLL